MVGESGSGKSAAAMAVIGLLPEYATVSGSARLDGRELLGMPDGEMSAIRGARIGTVFQDPMSALTPVYTVGDQIAEAIRIHHRDVTKQAALRRAVDLLELVGIAQPQQRARAFPHELSGGERQRVVIAIAIANDPDLIICDEPTTALDVTVQAQILEVLKTAREVTDAGVLIITHDLGVVAEFADRALVMYAGRAVEVAGVEELYTDRRMPYTAGLLGSVPGWTPLAVRGWFRYREHPVAGRTTARLPVRPALPTGRAGMPISRTLPGPRGGTPCGSVHSHRSGGRAERRGDLRGGHRATSRAHR